MPLLPEHPPLTREYLRSELDVAVTEASHYLRRASNQPNGSLPEANDLKMSEAWTAHADLLMRVDRHLDAVIDEPEVHPNTGEKQWIGGHMHQVGHDGSIWRVREPGARHAPWPDGWEKTEFATLDEADEPQNLDLPLRKDPLDGMTDEQKAHVYRKFR